MSKKRKEARQRIKQLLAELEKLREQFSEQSQDQIPDYNLELSIMRLDRVIGYFKLDEECDTADWLEMELATWRTRLAAEKANLSRKSQFYLEYLSLKGRIEAMGGKLDVDYYDSDSAFGEQFQVKVSLPRKKKVGTKKHYMFFNEYDLAFTKAWLIEIEKAHEERKVFINANS